MIMRALWLFAISALLFSATARAQTTSDYDTLVQKGKTQLQAGTADLALASGEAAIEMNGERWEGYALAGGALMNLKRYEEAADKFSKAIEKAPEAKQAALRDLRRQSLTAEPGSRPAAKESAPTTTTQAEIVLWKLIENSTSTEDFHGYLNQYPQGAFTVLARQHLVEAERERERQAALYGSLPNSVWMGEASSTDKVLHYTLLVVFLDNGRVVWKDFLDTKDYIEKLAQTKSDLESLSKERFLRTYLPQLQNRGTFTLETGTMLKWSWNHAVGPCQPNFEGHLNQDAISGTKSFVGDSTREGHNCAPEEWDLQRMFR
jgi:tetratricopeptide (TPR) repeat protein